MGVRGKSEIGQASHVADVEEEARARRRQRRAARDGRIFRNRNWREMEERCAPRAIAPTRKEIGASNAPMTTMRDKVGDQSRCVFQDCNVRFRAMRSQHIWTEKDEDGRKREVRVTKFGGVWRFQAKQQTTETGHIMIVRCWRICALRDIIFRKYQRRRASTEDLASVENIEQRSES